VNMHHLLSTAIHERCLTLVTPTPRSWCRVPRAPSAAVRGVPGSAAGARARKELPGTAAEVLQAIKTMGLEGVSRRRAHARWLKASGVSKPISTLEIPTGTVSKVRLAAHDSRQTSEIDVDRASARAMRCVYPSGNCCAGAAAAKSWRRQCCSRGLRQRAVQTCPTTTCLGTGPFHKIRCRPLPLLRIQRPSPAPKSTCTPHTRAGGRSELAAC
jgi:hypothetical protein